MHCSRLSTALVAALALGAGLSACKKDAPAAPAATPTAATPAAATPAAAPAASNEALGEKLSGYIDCYNQADPAAHRSMDRYLSWVKDPAAGPTGKEQNVYGLYDINTSALDACKQGIAKSATAAPALPALDSAAKAYDVALQALAPKVQEAHDYYDRGNYKDDAFAKGKSMHAGLMEAFKSFNVASTAFSDALEAENDKHLAAQLQEVEKSEGRKADYFHLAQNGQAKTLTGMLESDNPDLAKAQAQLDAFEKLADEAIAYGKTPDDKRSAMWDSYQRSVEEYRKAAKERVRRVRDKTPYDVGEQNLTNANSEWMVNGSAAQLVRAYNQMVEAGNRL